MPPVGPDAGRSTVIPPSAAHEGEGVALAGPVTLIPTALPSLPEDQRKEAANASARDEKTPSALPSRSTRAQRDPAG